MQQLFFHGWKNCPLLATCLSQSASQWLRICIHSSLSSDKRATRWHSSGASLSAYNPPPFAATPECCVVVDLPEQKHLPRTAADRFDFQSFSCPVEDKLFIFISVDKDVVTQLRTIISQVFGSTSLYYRVKTNGNLMLFWTFCEH